MDMDTMGMRWNCGWNRLAGEPDSQTACVMAEGRKGVLNICMAAFKLGEGEGGDWI